MGKFMNGFHEENIIMDKTLFINRYSLSVASHKNEYLIFQEKIRSIGLLCKLTKFLDFNCKFVEGRCKDRQGKPITSNRESYMGCCSECYNTKGHLRKHIFESNINTYCELFKEDVGFWRFETGCSLPRDLRSPLCLYFNCHEDIEFRHIANELRHTIENYLNEILILSKKLMEELAKRKNTRMET